MGAITWTVTLKDVETGRFSELEVMATDRSAAERAAVAYFAQFGMDVEAVIAVSSELRPY